jgi:hypothetical protein
MKEYENTFGCECGCTGFMLMQTVTEHEPLQAGKLPLKEISMWYLRCIKCGKKKEVAE